MQTVYAVTASDDKVTSLHKLETDAQRIVDRYNADPHVTEDMHADGAPYTVEAGTVS